MKGCEQLAQVVDCLERRTVPGVPFYPVVRRPRDAAQRVRSLNWNRQWSPIVIPLLEYFLERRMRELVEEVPVQPVSEGSGSRGTREVDGVAAPSHAHETRDVEVAEVVNDDVVQPVSSSSSSTSSRSASRSPVGAGRIRRVRRCVGVSATEPASGSGRDVTRDEVGSMRVMILP